MALHTLIGTPENEDILNALRGYRQRPVRISSTPCEDILAKKRRSTHVVISHGKTHAIHALFTSQLLIILNKRHLIYYYFVTLQAKVKKKGQTLSVLWASTPLWGGSANRMEITSPNPSQGGE